jgi:serine/threonine protein kinase
MSDETLPGAPGAQGALSRGATFGRYIIDEYLGGGGMASVYSARHADLGRLVAIKLLHENLTRDDAHVQRFLQEARAASSLRHPHVVDVSDVGISEGRPFLVMEHLRGESLAARLDRQGRMNPTDLAALLLPVLSAVSAAHSAGIVHRDIKPENIFLASDGRGGDRPVLLDFGISKLVGGGVPSKALTQAGQFVGTPYYMSPEQIQQQEPIDGRTDQYALGVVLYECSTGVLPFRSEQSLFVLMAEVVFGKPEAPTSHVPTLPKAFERLILRAMATSREDRFPSVDALARALLAFAAPEVHAHWAREFATDPYSEPPEPTSFRPSRPPIAPLSAAMRRPERHGVSMTAEGLRRLPDLEDRTDDELGAFLLAVSAYRYPKGARVFTQGDVAEACFLVIEGELEIVKDIAGTLAVLNVLHAGDIVGQMAVVDDALRSATVIARTDVVALEVSREVFRRLLASGSPIAMRLQVLLAISGIRQLRQATRRFSQLLEERAGASPDELEELEARQTPRLEHLRAAVGEWSVKIGSR